VELQQSSLCRDDPVTDDVDGLADLYESELKTILDWLIPSRQTTRRH